MQSDHFFVRCAIEVKYLGPTNYRPSRWKATCDHPEGRLTVSYDHGLNSSDNALAAAKALLKKVGWNPATLAGGALPNGNYCFVIVDSTINVE